VRDRAQLDEINRTRAITIAQMTARDPAALLQ
jgi:hypothetical protein